MPPPKRKPAKPAGSFLVKIGFALSALTLVIAIFGVLSIGVAAVACGLGYSAAKQGNPTGRMVILSAILALAVGLLIGVATM